MKHFSLLIYSNLFYFHHLQNGVGGYVGLFIGYTVSQAPSLLLSFIGWIRKVPKSLKRLLNENENLT